MLLYNASKESKQFLNIMWKIYTVNIVVRVSLGLFWSNLSKTNVNVLYSGIHIYIFKLSNKILE